MKKLIIILTLFIVFSCMNKTKTIISMRKQYFESWSGYNHPIKPISEISEDRLLEHTGPYYIATYKDDNLIVFEKVHDNSTLFKYEYKYDDLGKLETATLVNKDGVKKNIPLKGN